MSVVIPPGGTLLDTFRKSFVDVPVDADKNNAISTTEFLEAAESLTTMFGMPCSCLGIVGERSAAEPAI